MKNYAPYLALALIAITLTGCSSELSKPEAEAKLTAAHEECLSKSLKSEVPEFDIKFKATSSALVYRYEDQGDRTFVECVSKNLFGQDVTSLKHTREDKLAYESRGFDSSYLDDYFISIWHKDWVRPINFARFDGSLPSYHFYWFSPETE